MIKIIKCTLFIIIISSYTHAQNNTIDFSSLRNRQIDTISFNGYPIQKYLEVFNLAVKYKSDSIKENKFKGNVIMSVLAEDFKEDLKREVLDPKNDKVEQLIKNFEKNKYLVYQPRPSNFIKLMYYLCNYKEQSVHIKNRFYGSVFFIPTVIVLIVFIGFTVLNLLSIIRWRHKKKYFLFLIASLILIIVISIIFNQTCDECIKKDSFYGISM